MTRARWAGLLALAVWSLSVASLLVGCVMAVVDADTMGWSKTLNSLPLGIPALAIGSVGLLIATRRRDNAIGWLYLGCGLWLSFAVAVDGYAAWATVVSPGGFGGTAAEWFGNWTWAPFLSVMLTFPFLLFPDGHLLSDRWRPVAWGSGVVAVSWTLVTALVVAVYLGVVAAASAVTPVSDSLSVAFATLAAAAVFRPAVRWTQTSVDRRFDGAHYDSENTVHAFSERLAREVDAGVVTNELLEVLDKTVQPWRVGLWVIGGWS